MTPGRHGAPAPAALALVGLLSGPLLAGTGYDIDYDFPGHGADWYGRSVREEMSYEFPAEAIDLFLSGDDFGAGYDPAFDPLGLGPGLERTRTHNTEYTFRFGPTGAGGPGAAACADGLDNDGDGLFDYPSDPGCLSPDDTDERNPGGPACDDGIDNDGDLLIDYPADRECDSPYDTSEAAEEIPFLSVDSRSLFWSMVADAVGYDVVYGDLQQLASSGGDFALAGTSCLGDDLPDLTLPLSLLPRERQGYWFLVRAVRTKSNGTYDSGGAGQAAPRDAGIAGSPLACP